MNLIVFLACGANLLPTSKRGEVGAAEMIHPLFLSLTYTQLALLTSTAISMSLPALFPMVIM